MKDAEALAKIVDAHPHCAAFEKLWSLRMPLPDHDQKAWLFGGGAEFALAAVAEAHPPLVLAAPDWTTTRKGNREREITAMVLYTGWLVWRRRTLAAPSEKMLAQAEQARAREAKHAQSTAVDIMEIVHVPKFGGTHTTLRAKRLTTDYFVNQSGRATTCGATTTLRAIDEHATWYFLGLENLPQRPFRKTRWPLR